MEAKTVLKELRSLGDPGYRKILLNHGAHPDCYGVKIAELKKFLKRPGADHALALELYRSGNYDAMYLAGLMADDRRMTRRDLREWVATASAPLAASTVAWVAAGSGHGWEIGQEWIDSKEELVAAAGWATLLNLVSITPDAELDVAGLRRLLKRVQTGIHKAPNGVRRWMNGFVIATGSFVGPLTEAALAAGEKMGTVTVDVGNTACEIPSVAEAVGKVAARGAIGRKRATAKC
jgi:hypothetical protein